MDFENPGRGYQVGTPKIKPVAVPNDGIKAGSLTAPPTLTLHEAVRSGDANIVRTLLNRSNGVSHQNGAVSELIDINAIEDNKHKRTPLMVASAEGYFNITQMLIEAGADTNLTDASGMNAKELAALEGNLRIAAKLRELEVEAGRDEHFKSTENGLSFKSHASEFIAKGPLKDKAMIMVQLGSSDARKGFPGVRLATDFNDDTVPFNGSLVVKMRPEQAGGEAQVNNVSVKDNCAAQPVVFYATDPTRAKLVFDIVHEHDHNSKSRPSGARAFAMLSNVMGMDASTTHVSLYRDINAPLISDDADRDVIGYVTFNILIVRPFHHDRIANIQKQAFPPPHRPKAVSNTMVIGHRGLGKNMEAKDFLQLGENTIDSFNTAARLGAEYVEFDVQVTKDRVPVIYHDFLVGEAGVDIPIHEVTTEQLMSLGNKDIKSPHSLPSKIAERLQSSRPRSMSSGFLNDISTTMKDREERMGFTHAMRARGFKANTPGRHIVAPFTTLEEMFHKIDKDTGFNIEVKYPMLMESERIGNPAWNSWELNLFVDTILTKVFDLCQSADGKTRNIYFSSFNADVCMLLKLKQDRFPVMFLTDGDGRTADRIVSDLRSSNLSQAVSFCQNWGLDGIVSEASPLVMSPKLVTYIRDRGLRCASFGTINNDVESVMRQVAEGIDAVIVDRVGRVVKGLREINGTQVNGKAH